MTEAAGLRLPDFLVLGAAKAGTTSLAAWLADHPDVFVSRNKELHFFSRDANYDAGLPSYAEHFAEARPDQRAGEATPSYIFNAQAPARIADAVPAATLIVLLRDPVDRAYSQYWYNKTRGVESRSFEEAIDAELADPQLEHTPANLAYLTAGRYLPQLERYAALFPRDQLHVLLFEDLKHEPKGLFSEVCGLLGVDRSFVPASVGSVFNPSHTIRSEGLRRQMMRFRAWDRLPRRIVRRIDTWNRAPMEYPPLDPRVRGRLDDTLAEDTEKLAAWLGRDLDEWDVTE
jgi:hypothetical protein